MNTTNRTSDEKCPQVGDVIHCHCGKPSSHYGTMGYRGAREVREQPVALTSNPNSAFQRLALIRQTVADLEKDGHSCEWGMEADIKWLLGFLDFIPTDVFHRALVNHGVIRPAPETLPVEVPKRLPRQTKDGWLCPECGGLNSRGRTLCQVCPYMIPRTASQAPAWNCQCGETSCTYCGQRHSEKADEGRG